MCVATQNRKKLLKTLHGGEYRHIWKFKNRWEKGEIYGVNDGFIGEFILAVDCTLMLDGPVRSYAPFEPIVTKFCLWGWVVNVITDVS